MKYLVNEHKAFKSAIESLGLPYEAFSFVKKKGVMHIRYNDQEPAFLYHRKIELQMDEQNQYTELAVYKLADQTVTDWDAVLQLFKNWLQQI